jgi:pyruvate ferredoxin oxidoreductase delta subunit
MGALAPPNVRAARSGYERCVKQHALADDTRFVAPPPASTMREAPLFPVSSTDSLALRTGGWSVERPVIQAACTACAVCALFCPEGAISRNDGSLVIDYDHCKGCGICEVVCPVRNAIAMEEVFA